MGRTQTHIVLLKAAEMWYQGTKISSLQKGFSLSSSRPRASFGNNFVLSLFGVEEIQVFIQVTLMLTKTAGVGIFSTFHTTALWIFLFFLLCYNPRQWMNWNTGNLQWFKNNQPSIFVQMTANKLTESNSTRNTDNYKERKKTKQKKC